MTVELTHEALSKNLNSRFTVCLDEGQSFELELIELSEHKLSSMQERFAFVLLGPNDKFLGQGTRHFQHEALGEFDLFLVPMGRNESGTRYEVVFNRFLKQKDPQA